MGVMIRKGEPGDADVAARLILSAAEALIAAVLATMTNKPRLIT